MTDSFAGEAMAIGYAKSRPDVHARILERVKKALGDRRFGRALDVGCGAGISTRAARILADVCIGADAVERMVRYGGETAPGAAFMVARGEALPVRAQSVDLITAAGSLNYMPLAPFLQEAARVSRAGGMLVVYDFSTGRRLRDSAALEDWFDVFVQRYPWPEGDATHIDAEVLERGEYALEARISEEFDIGVPLTRTSYVSYLMTETNVTRAVRDGAAAEAIREWCLRTLHGVFPDGTCEVLFRGYFMCMAPRVSGS
jgi:SAM-dependent methyltransferase